MIGNIQSFRGITPKIADDAFVATTAVIVGDVEIASGANIWYHCVLRGDGHEIRVGKNANIQDGTVVHIAKSRFGAYIGDNVTIGHMALIHACTLEPGSMVGMSATVMDGAVVEEGALVAAGALVTPGKRVKAGEMWGGSPARFIRKVSESDIAMINRISPLYADLGAEYREEGLDLRQNQPFDEAAE